MAMLLDDVLPMFMGDLPECPDITAKAELINAAREFCEYTQVWNEIQDPFKLVDNQPVYDIDLPKDGQVVAVMALYSACFGLRSKTMAEIQLLLPDWQSAVSSQPAYYNAVSGRSQLRVFPIPLNANSALLTARVAYKPKLGATTLPDALMNDYHEVIIDGALARLMSKVNKPWTNAAGVAFHGARFDTTKVDVRLAVVHENTDGSLVARPSRAFGS